ncbi:related to ANT1-peroxisomal ATP carrier [Serendipita indica DSM 11827]|uniref:Related to ANT1-peroxisomal ATP carrier n=1 Tax=Serendipita indica (strain DSM 11827) TaxID=1109443 RepID=G4TNF8_SERID|nr:related to ANT1-peroxisomal ATP carrier [Serendipita indica DSM 11827]
MGSQSKPVQQLTPFGHALAGALGGVFSNAVVYPLDTVKTRIQATSSDESRRKGKSAQSTSITSLLLQILKQEGVAGFYKGFGASMLNTFSMQYAYFFFYSFVRSTYIKRTTKAGKKPEALSTAVELILGAVAGALAQIFTIPVSVIATRQQIGRSVAVKKSNSLPSIPTPRSQDQPSPSEQVTLPSVTQVEQSVEESHVERTTDDSFLAVAREIIQEDGVTGLWLGIHSSLVLTVNPAITYGVFERVKSIFTLGDPTVKMGPWRAFLVGALSKTLATIVTYPYIMAKVRVQAHGSKLESSEKGSTTAAPKYNGALDVLRKVYKSGGIIGWYQGMSAQILKAVLAQAFLFMTKEQFEQYALIIMVAWGRLRNASPA